VGGKGFHVDPEHLKRSGKQLGDFGSKVGGHGSRLAQTGQRLAAHAGRDKSGIGGAIVKAMGKP
jgi:hypothetical protein